MQVANFGTGSVGLVTGTCLADVGHDLNSVDIDQAKVDGLNHCVIPLANADAKTLVSEWTQFRSPESKGIRKALADVVVGIVGGKSLVGPGER